MVPGEGRPSWLGCGDALGPPLDGDRGACAGLRRIQGAGPPSPAGCGATTSLVEARRPADARVRSEPRGSLQGVREPGRRLHLDGTRRGAVQLAWLRRRPRSAARRGPRGVRGTPSKSRRRSAVPGRLRSNDVSCRGLVARRRPGTIRAPGLSPGSSRARATPGLGWYPARGGPAGLAAATLSVRRSTGTSGRARDSVECKAPVRRPRSAAEQRRLLSRPGGPQTPGCDPSPGAP